MSIAAADDTPRPSFPSPPPVPPPARQVLTTGTFMLDDMSPEATAYHARRGIRKLGQVQEDVNQMQEDLGEPPSVLKPRGSGYLGLIWDRFNETDKKIVTAGIETDRKIDGLGVTLKQIDARLAAKDAEEVTAKTVRDAKAEITAPLGWAARVAISTAIVGTVSGTLALLGTFLAKHYLP